MGGFTTYLSKCQVVFFYIKVRAIFVFCMWRLIFEKEIVEFKKKIEFVYLENGFKFLWKVIVSNNEEHFLMQFSSLTLKKIKYTTANRTFFTFFLSGLCYLKAFLYENIGCFLHFILCVGKVLFGIFDMCLNTSTFLWVD